MFNRQNLPLIGIAAGVIALFILGLYTLNNQPRVDTPSPTDLPPAQEENPEEHTDHIHSDLYVNDMSEVEAAFGDKSIFISNRIREYTDLNFPDSTESAKIDNDTFVKRDTTSYGFTVANGDGTGLFYVIATKLPDGEVRVQFYQ